MRLRASAVEAGPGIAQIAAAATRPELEERHDRVRHGGVQPDEAAGEGDATVDRRGERLQRHASLERAAATDGAGPLVNQARRQSVRHIGQQKNDFTSGKRDAAAPVGIVKPRRPMQDDVEARLRATGGRCLPVAAILGRRSNCRAISRREPT